jgi:hypothetical protein
LKFEIRAKIKIEHLKFPDRSGLCGKTFFLGKQKGKKTQKEQKRIILLFLSLFALFAS